MLNISDVDWDKFKIAKSGRAYKLLYDKEPVKFCTSTLYTPFGVNSVNKEWSNFTEYSVNCSVNSFNNKNENAKVLEQFLEKLDEKILELVNENLSLFENTKGDQLGSDFNYYKILRENGDYPKLMKLQFVRDKNGNFESFVFDENKEKIKLSDSNIEDTIQKRTMFKCIIECGKIWTFNNKLGSIWNIVQLKLSSKNNKFQSDNNNEECSVYENDYTGSVANYNQINFIE